MRFISQLSWHVLMRMKSPRKGSGDSIELPPSLHAFRRASPSDQANMVRHSSLANHLFLFLLYDHSTNGFVLFLQEGYHTFRGGFWNYFSLGKNFSKCHLKFTLSVFSTKVTCSICFLDLLASLINFIAGMDAQTSYEFHSQRKLHPENFKNQLVNQVYILCSRSF